MDRVKTDKTTRKAQRYRQIAQTVSSELAAFFEKAYSKSGGEIMFINDKAKGQFLIFNDSWQHETRDYGCVCHIEVKDNGRVWLRHDGTDIEIGQQLLDAGIEKSDLVIGFHSPKMREWSDFAVA
jgi:hypothetical protein